MSQRRERAIDVPKHSSDVRPIEHPFGIERKVLAQPVRRWCEETKPNAELGIGLQAREASGGKAYLQLRATTINAPAALIGPVKHPG